MSKYIGIIIVMCIATIAIWLLCSSLNDKNGGDTYSYINNYPNLPRVDCKSQVILALTTDPENIDSMKPMVDSILNQSVKVDRISLFLHEPEKQKLPSWVMDVMNIHPMSKEYKSCIVPSLLKEKECDTVILVLDEKKVYPKTFIEKMISESKKNPGKVLTNKDNTCILMRPEYYDPDVINRDQKDISVFTKNSIQIK